MQLEGEVVLERREQRVTGYSKAHNKILKLFGPKLGLLVVRCIDI